MQAHRASIHGAVHHGGSDIGLNFYRTVEDADHVVRLKLTSFRVEAENRGKVIFYR